MFFKNLHCSPTLQGSLNLKSLTPKKLMPPASCKYLYYLIFFPKYFLWLLHSAEQGLKIVKLNSCLRVELKLLPVWVKHTARFREYVLFILAAARGGTFSIPSEGSQKGVEILHNKSHSLYLSPLPSKNRAAWPAPNPGRGQEDGSQGVTGNNPRLTPGFSGLALGICSMPSLPEHTGFPAPPSQAWLK